MLFQFIMSFLVHQPLINFSGSLTQLMLSEIYNINTLRPRQNGRNFADDTFKHIFLNQNVRISIKISLKFVPKSPINYIAALVLIMAWRRPGDKPLSEPMMARLPTHICVTRPQWVNSSDAGDIIFWLWRPISCTSRHDIGRVGQTIGIFFPELISFTWLKPTVPFHNDFSHSGEQPEQRESAHTL